jgi:hypothetical protein
MGLIYRNTVTLNSGGGLGECKGIILGNVIACNSSSFQGGGLRRCRGLIANNNIVHNAADLGGGLADCISDKDGEARIVNNTVYGNISRGGGGLYRCDRAVVTNCIIWGNTPAENQIEVGTQPLSAPEVVYSCIQGWTQGGEGNFSADPMFLDPEGPDDDPQTYQDNDYRLSADSPCIDAGDNWAVDPGQMDGDGNLRIAFGRYSLTVDMGAYELGSPRFQVTQIAIVDGDRLLLTWNSQPGDAYTLWSSGDLPGEPWTQERASPIPCQGAITSCLVDISPSVVFKTYRVEMR